MSARSTFGTRESFGRRAPAREIAYAAPAETAAAASGIVTNSAASWPLMTFGIAAILLAIFVLELHVSVDPMPHLTVSLRNSVALGGVGPYFVFHEKEWWRIFTAPFLHGSVGHLIGNTVALCFAGVSLERMLGHIWLAALFLVGAVCGSLGSLVYGTAVVSVGASGAIMCLVTVLLALSFHYAAGPKANRLRRRALIVVVSAFLPSAGPGAMQIDYGAHLGGFVAGMALGFFFLIRWHEEDASPGLRGAAAVVAIAGLGMTVLSAILVSARYPVYAARSANLIPSALEQSDPAGVARRSEEFAGRYPHDPLARLLHGTDLFNLRDYSAAEEQARAGLGEGENLTTEYAPTLRTQLEMLLAASLFGEGRRDEARSAAAPFCDMPSTDQYLAKGRELFQQAGICN